MGKLSIRDEGVNELAESLAGILGVNKTEAVKRALENEIKRQESRPQSRIRSRHCERSSKIPASSPSSRWKAKGNTDVCG